MAPRWYKSDDDIYRYVLAHSSLSRATRRHLSLPRAPDVGALSFEYDDGNGIFYSLGVLSLNLPESSGTNEAPPEHKSF